MFRLMTQFSDSEFSIQKLSGYPVAVDGYLLRLSQLYY